MASLAPKTSMLTFSIVGRYRNRLGNLGFRWILFSDHPRSPLDDLKLCLKFHVDPIYTFEDIAILIFGILA